MVSMIQARVKKAAAVIAAGSLGAFTLGGVTTPAGATTGVVDYACDNALTGAFVLRVEIDALAEKVYVGEPFEVVTRTYLPQDVAKKLYDDRQARSFTGAIALGATLGNSPSTISQLIPATEIPDQGSATAVPFSATGPVTLTDPGDVLLKAQDLVATLELADAGGQPTDPATVVATCARPNGPAPAIDTVVVAARSATTLTLSRTTSSYGEKVTATAKVTTTGGTPSGDVAFVVDGVATKARVTKDGVATLDIANARLGAHTVTATFVPGDATHYDPSTSAPAAWTVGRATSRIAPTITGKRTSKPTRVAVQVSGSFGTEATGKVRIRLMKLGTRKAWLKVRTLRGGKAAAGFGRLVKGRYKVAIVYRGDAHHLKTKKVRKIRVKRG